MSAALISRSPDLQRLISDGFEIEIRGGHLVVNSVPYLNPTGLLRRARLFCPLTLTPDGQSTVAPADHTIFFDGETPSHRDGSPMEEIIHSSERKDMGDGLVATHYFSSKPEGTGRYPDFYEKVVAYERLLGAQARSFDPTATAKTAKQVNAVADGNPFQYPDTASARYRIGSVTGKLAVARVGIIGLGGTGSYVLDLVAKTPVREIHIFDGDQFLHHNAFRSPGAAAEGELKGFPLKVEHYERIYSRMHRGIRAHPVRVTQANIGELSGFDFVFVCVDRGSSREAISIGLNRLGVPFIDTGIGVGLQDGLLDGMARSTLVMPGEAGLQAARSHLSFGDGDADDPYATEIQIADLNMLNAALAVFRWKRFMKFYRDGRGETNSSFMVEGNFMANRVQ